MRAYLKIVLFIILGTAFFSCTKKQEAPSGASLSAQDLIARGQQIYVANCIACHNVDPKKDGSLGPSLWGSSLELLEARVLKADYPTGYKAKRDTRQMVALPHLKNEIAGLHAYLNN